MATHPRPGIVAGGENVQHNGNDLQYCRLAALVNAACTCTLDPENAAAEFAERAAILEFDGGLTREEAEAQAGLCISPQVPHWRIGRVEFFGRDRAWYQPCEDGPALAVIVPVVEFGDPVDLAAIDLATQHVGTCLGIGKALGLDAIDDVRCNGGTLTLLDKPLDWLREPAAAACIIDWSIAAFTLANLDRPATTLADRPIEVRCSSFALAERITRAFARPLPAPQLQVRAA